MKMSGRRYGGFQDFDSRRDKELYKTIEEVGNELNDLANSKSGMIMTERSRKLTSYLLAGCSSFMKEESEIQEIHSRAHLLRLLRSDLGIENYEYENEMNRLHLSWEEWMIGCNTLIRSNSWQVSLLTVEMTGPNPSAMRHLSQMGQEPNSLNLNLHGLFGGWPLGFGTMGLQRSGPTL
ncbi:MAG: hypothetical protein QM771_08505 [Nitrospira sp.]